MSHIVDDDPPIKTGPVTKAYCDGWERTFGERAPETVEVNLVSADAPIGTFAKGTSINWLCAHCGASGNGGVHGCAGLGRYTVDFDSWTR